jgi:hypothetical protein
MAELRKLAMAGDYEVLSRAAEPIARSLVGDLRSPQRHRPSFEVLMVGDIGSEMRPGSLSPASTLCTGDAPRWR